MSIPNRTLLRLLVVEDDTDDQLLVLDALREASVPHDVYFAHDGAELMAYINREGEHADPSTSPLPHLVILDLHMPRLSGFEVLEKRRENPVFRLIPVIVMSSSWSEEDIARCYTLGVNSFITKPVSFDHLVRVMRTIGTYWLEVCELPDLHRA